MRRTPHDGRPSPRTPDLTSEQRLAEIRREAEQRGEVKAAGVRPSGAPFPMATAETGYYGVPLLKEPQWTKEVPLYLFVGGAAGAAAVVGSAANFLTQDDELVRSARWVAAVGGILSPALLSMDLGRPSRFLNMLRVFKLQSPMSVGAWTLTAFSSFSAAAAFANAMRQKLDATPVYILENAAGVLAAATGLVMSSYTGVLIGATTIPVWNRNVGELPIHFGASGLSAAVGLLEMMGHRRSRALQMLGLGAAIFECWEGWRIESRQQPGLDPLKRGTSGWMVRTGGALSGPVPAALRALSMILGNEGSRALRRWAGISAVAGSLITRIAWVHAGHVSARDWRGPLEISDPPCTEKGSPRGRDPSR